jgi:uncharacterized glyoxalase superfamily protein PhnB
LLKEGLGHMLVGRGGNGHGGTVTVPLEKQMWGDEFGACMDQFGIPWMVNITQPG